MNSSPSLSVSASVEDESDNTSSRSSTLIDWFSSLASLLAFLLLRFQSFTFNFPITIFAPFLGFSRNW